MTCQQAIELIPLYVVGTLADDESGNLQSHLATGCPACNGLLAELTSVGASLAMTLPPQQAGPDVHASLMARIRRHQAEAPSAVRPSAGRGYVLAAWSAGLAAAAAVVITYVALQSHWRATTVAQGRKLALAEHRLYALQSKYKTTLEDTALLKLQIRQADTMHHMFMAKHLQVVALSGKPVHKSAMGRIFYNAKTHMWQFCAMDLKPLPPSKTYELWFITTGKKKIPAGTFNVNARGDGMLTASVGQNMSVLSAVAVTDEPAGGVQAPTGKIQLIGTLQ